MTLLELPDGDRTLTLTAELPAEGNQRYRWTYSGETVREWESDDVVDEAALRIVGEALVRHGKERRRARSIDREVFPGGVRVSLLGFPQRDWLFVTPISPEKTRLTIYLREDRQVRRISIDADRRSACIQGRRLATGIIEIERWSQLRSDAAPA